MRLRFAATLLAARTVAFPSPQLPGELRFVPVSEFPARATRSCTPSPHLKGKIMSKSTASSRRGPVRAALRASAACRLERLEGRRLLSAATSFVSGELLVGFRPGVSQADITRFYSQHGFTERQALDRQIRPSDGRL